MMHSSLGLICLLQEKVVSDVMGEHGSSPGHRVRELVIIASARQTFLQHMHDIIATFPENFCKSQSNIFIKEQ